MAFANYDEAVKKYRKYLNDTPQLNTLDREIENTDDELEDYIKDCLNEINFGYQPQTKFSLADICVEPGVDPGILVWSVVKLGATLQLLTAKGIISARNTVTYSDAGGIQVNEMDKYGRYINYFNLLANKFERQVMQIKIAQNLSDGFGGVYSPMGYDYTVMG